MSDSREIRSADLHPVDIATTDLAIIANAHTPYRAHLHHRIVAEMTDVRLWSIYTHEFSNAPWPFNAAAELRPILMGPGENSSDQGKPTLAMRDFLKGGRIIRFLRDQKIRAVLMIGYNDLGRLRIIQWCHRHRIPCFLWADSNVLGDNPKGVKRWIKRRLLGWLLKRCIAVLACGRRGAEYFVKYGADPNRIFLSPYEPDYESIRTISPTKVEEVRRRFDLKQGVRQIVFSGRLVDVKRCDLAIDAFLAIADRRTNWGLVIAGDGPLRDALVARVPQRFRSRVIWTGFLSDQSDVTAVYRLCDVLVLPSDFEPWALVVNEAVATGLAVIVSSAVGSAPELVSDGVNGRIFPPGNLNSLVDAMLEVTDDSNLRRMKSASAGILAEWRRKADPVDGLRAALQIHGLLS